MVLAGRCPTTISPLFCAGRLIALAKKPGGIWPIAVGMSFHRLVSKCTNSFGTSRLATYSACNSLELVPRMAVRQQSTQHTDNTGNVRQGGRGQVRLLQRVQQPAPVRHVASAVRDRIPALLPHCYSSYAQPSMLFYEGDVVLSQEGTQQGDPLGPLLFSNTAQPLLQSLSSALTLGCLDDVTLGGSLDVVAADVQKIITEDQAMGLCLNNTKCKIIAHQQTVIADPTLCSYTRVSIEDATLLGAPLFARRVLDEA